MIKIFFSLPYEKKKYNYVNNNVIFLVLLLLVFDISEKQYLITLAIKNRLKSPSLHPASSIREKVSQARIILEGRASLFCCQYYSSCSMQLTKGPLRIHVQHTSKQAEHILLALLLIQQLPITEHLMGTRLCLRQAA